MLKYNFIHIVPVIRNDIYKSWPESFVWQLAIWKNNNCNLLKRFVLTLIVWLIAYFKSFFFDGIELLNKKNETVVRAIRYYMFPSFSNES